MAKLSRLIAEDTVTEVVDPELIARLRATQYVRHTELVRGSVSIRRSLAKDACLSSLNAIADNELYIWPEGEYDNELLGIMKYLLTLKTISSQGFAFQA